MTSHRLLRCSLDTVLQVTPRSGRRRVLTARAVPDCPGWRYRESPPPGRSVTWRTRGVVGSTLSWCLEVEPGANGVLTHLSVAALDGPLARIPPEIRRPMLYVLTQRTLGHLARSVEALPSSSVR
jgi:hypothetical protein